MNVALVLFNILFLVYFAVLNGFYLVLTVVALRGLRSYIQRLRSLDIDSLVSSSGGLPISLVVPAYNESVTIVESVRSLLTLRYADYEIVVVNDGSSDGTLERLIAAFELERIERVATSDVPTATVHRVYRSKRHPNLLVVDKDNGGKADALNAGLNYSRGAIFCAMDADTLLESDALARIVRPFLEDRSTVAVGGIVRVANGCKVEGGTIDDIRLPDTMLPRFQVLEYLRAFLASRVGWDALGATLIISGAFGAFRRSAVEAVGGFDTRSVGEDMELIVRLHRHFRDRKIPYSIKFIPDPVAWTEAPETLSQLSSQRDRWQRGLVQVISRHHGMVGRPRYGIPGVVALPYYVMFEMLGPIIELLGWIAFLVALYLGLVSTVYMFAFLALAVFMGSMFSIAAVALEELSFRRYRRSRDLVVLLGLALIESFGYRQLITVWRLRGLISALRNDRSWGEMERSGFTRVTHETEAHGA